MSRRPSRPVVLALFRNPEPRVPAMMALVSEHGFGSIVTVDEVEFMNRLGQSPGPDVVLLEHADHPVCSALKARPDTAHIPVVLIDDEPTVQAVHSFKVGASAVCCRPDDPETLARMLTVAMRSRGKVALAGR
ncbi:MAG: hypothetical protein V1907_01540 [Candidatus Kerfeldbacteria bacterium]